MVSPIIMYLLRIFWDPGHELDAGGREKKFRNSVEIQTGLPVPS